jgi:hypothetical protein
MGKLVLVMSEGIAWTIDFFDSLVVFGAQMASVEYSDYNRWVNGATLLGDLDLHSEQFRDIATIAVELCEDWSVGRIVLGALCKKLLREEFDARADWLDRLNSVISYHVEDIKGDGEFCRAVIITLCVMVVVASRHAGFTNDSLESLRRLI